jgi:hypothetical protein
MFSSMDILIFSMFFPIYQSNIDPMRFHLLQEKYGFDHEDNSTQPSPASLPSINVCPRHPNLICTAIPLEVISFGHLGQTF